MIKGKRFNACLCFLLTAVAVVLRKTDVLLAWGFSFVEFHSTPRKGMFPLTLV